MVRHFPAKEATQKCVWAFESPSLRQYAPLAQLAEQRTLNPKVVGSIPPRRTKSVSLAQW